MTQYATDASQPAGNATAVGATSASSAAAAIPAGVGAWWRDAVIYQVYPRSFADSNGDGVGDLPGVRSRLPYLRDLGVDAVWLSPFYASPQADGGYDVADYRAIDPVFGTLHDADALIRDAHGLGLRIIVDLVPNHSSDQHPWFRRALREGPGSASRKRYHFCTGRGEDGVLPPNDWESIFGGPAWTRTTDPDGSPGDWYLHLFAPEQPDFNWEHPAVADEFRSILRFWLDMGVDGFRIDVAHGLVKAAGLPDVGFRDQLKLLGNDVMPFFDQDGVHEIYRAWRTILNEYPGERIAVAEAWTPSAARTANYVRSDELHQAFNFQYLNTAWDAAALREAIDLSLAAMCRVDAPSTWVLSNHDTVRHTTRLADDAADRPAGLRRARAASLLMLALPGSAYLYQGEELGLPEVTELPDHVRQDPAFFRAAARDSRDRDSRQDSAGRHSADWDSAGQEGRRDGCRVPIPWSGTEAPYGFGPAGAPTWLPQPPEWAGLSVAAQQGDPASTLELYRSALAIRRGHPALGAGQSLTWLDGFPDGVLAFRRDASGASFACTVNLTAEPVRMRPPGRVLLASGGDVPLHGDVVLPPDSTVWWGV